jgi:CubicO group peptidase (beta-lactamase class C family)
LVGIAQEKGLIDINNKTSDYLGEGWTSMPAEKEDLILIRHQLTMTTGLDYQVPNPDCISSDCLKYKTDPGNQWFYHNAPYTLLESVISNAAGQSYNSFTDENIEAQIGMSGIWLNLGDNNVYTSTTRDAAKFGLLMLNQGTWNNDLVLSDKNYFNAMINSSQTLNSSYGYLTWLNGKSNIVYPGIPNQFNGLLSINAPSDLYAAMGKNGQFIDVVPSQQLVVVRFGESPDNSLVPVSYHNEMWAKINAMIN